jgi:hypothetical protein
MSDRVKLAQQTLFEADARFEDCPAPRKATSAGSTRAARVRKKESQLRARVLFALGEGHDSFEHSELSLLDAQCPVHEQLPRRFEVHFCPVEKDGQPAIQLFKEGVQVGDILTDNAHADDGYRFHDVFHFTHAAVLGWSPMSRTLFMCKRKSDPKTDMVEDGARAKILEELICALAFEYARKNGFLQGATQVDGALLKEINSIVGDREVRVRTEADWQSAILQGFTVWRAMRAHNGGVLIGDLPHRQVLFRAREKV